LNSTDVIAKNEWTGRLAVSIDLISIGIRKSIKAKARERKGGIVRAADTPYHRMSVWC